MSSSVTVMAAVEGQTEKLFIDRVLAPHLVSRLIYVTPIILSKPGSKGGDVRFDRAKNDIGRYLKQRSDTYVTLCFDYYGTRKDWPGFVRTESDQQSLTPAQKAERVKQATAERIAGLFPDLDTSRRFIPYVAMHEFEALLFSSPRILAERIGVDEAQISSIVTACGGPESINDSPQTAPSKRLEAFPNQFRKTTMGIAIAEEIGLPTIRAGCPLFDAWVTRLENLRPLTTAS